MNIFTPTTFTWWQIALLKWAVLFLGLAVGATWPEIVTPYVTPLLVIGLIISAYLAIVWFRKKQ